VGVTAKEIMDHDSTVYSQWFCRIENNVTKSLSHHHHLSCAKLLNLLSSCIPKKLPNNFRICQLLQDVISKIMTWLHNLLATLNAVTDGTTEKQACYWG
jgi:hypothetical protein